MNTPDQPTILVTGGTGFAGSHLIEELLTQRYTNIYSTAFSVGQTNLPLSADRYVQVDLSQADQTRALVERVKPDWIFHLAAFAYVGKSFEKAKELFANNISLQLNVLDAVRTVVPQAKILTIGSAEEYGMVDSLRKIDETVALRPVNPYAVSKVTQDLLADSYFLSYKLQVIRARPFNHIGTRQSADFAIPAFAKQIVAIERGSQTALQVGSLEAYRDFTSVQDVVRAYILLMEKGIVGEVYNIGTGNGIQMKRIVEQLIAFAHVPVPLQTDPTRIRPLDAPGLIADNRKMCALGWQPSVPIETELQNVLEEWRKK